MGGRRAQDEDNPGLFARLLRSKRATASLVLGVLLLFLVLTYAVVLNALRPHTPGRELTIDQLVAAVREEKVNAVTLLAEDHRLVGVDAQGPWWVGTGPFEVLTPQLLAQFTTDGVRTRIDTQTGKATLKLATQYALPTATLFVSFAFLYVLFRGSGSSGEFALLGRAKARRYVAGKKPDVTFADVAGLNEAIEELREVKDFLSSPETFERVGAKPPKGVLLLGPPGCGKTLLAKAVAGEAGVPFFAVSASSFGEMLVGVGAARVRDLFQQARAAAPSIIFIDEIDAMGRARSTNGSGNAEGESTLNELLVQLDGFNAAERVVLLAATNRADMLDDALVRKGRFDRHIVIDTPDYAGRLAIAKVHARNKPLAPDVDLERFARRTVGLSGAEIAAALNEAATLAARRRLSKIGHREISEAVDRVLAGPERHNRILSPSEKERVAYHEGGHALVGWTLSTTATVDKVSLVARGHSLGSTWSLPTEDRRVVTRSHMEEEIASALAGRAAEILVYGEPSGSAYSDLVRATQLARQMIFELGMSERLGPMSLTASGSDGWPLLGRGDELTQEAEREVQRVLREADERAQQVLRTHRKHLDRLAEALAARETLERSDLEMLLSDLPVATVTPQRPAAAEAPPRSRSTRTA